MEEATASVPPGEFSEKVWTLENRKVYKTDLLQIIMKCSGRNGETEMTELTEKKGAAVGDHIPQ